MDLVRCTKNFSNNLTNKQGQRDKHKEIKEVIYDVINVAKIGLISFNINGKTIGLNLISEYKIIKLFQSKLWLFIYVFVRIDDLSQDCSKLETFGASF